ncbi:hypothetical protein NQL31_001836 [Lotmaria passim]
MLVEAATRIRLPLSRTLLSEVGAEGFERLAILALSAVIGPRVAFESPRAGINRCAAELNAVPAAFDASSKR